MAKDLELVFGPPPEKPEEGGDELVALMGDLAAALEAGDAQAAADAFRAAFLACEAEPHDEADEE